MTTAKRSNEAAVTALVSERNDLLSALTQLTRRLEEHGDWADGCFYYNRVSASELETPLRNAERAIAKAEGGIL